MNTRVFFPTKEPQLHYKLETFLEWLEKQATHIPGLRAFLLAGGYGRGEGGIFYHPDGSPPSLYNDLEFYVFAPALSKEFLASWIHEGEKQLGIEIELKVMAAEQFEAAAPSMFYYDLLSRHVLVAGDQPWLDSLPKKLSDAAAIPAVEGSRLLVNRGMSLLRCQRWAAGEIELPNGFCERIASKLKLALADAVLCAVGRYHWSCVERDKRLPDLNDVPPDWEDLMAWHAEGVAFKFRPTDSSLAPPEWVEPLGLLREAWLSTFFWIESKRLGHPMTDSAGYARSSRKIFPEEPPLKNLIRQVRDLSRPAHLPFCWGDHPRSRIWKSLGLLLEGSEEAEAAALLGVPALRGIHLEEHCRTLWNIYP